MYSVQCTLYTVHSRTYIDSLVESTYTLCHSYLGTYTYRYDDEPLCGRVCGRGCGRVCGRGCVHVVMCNGGYYTWDTIQGSGVMGTYTGVTDTYTGVTGTYTGVTGTCTGVTGMYTGVTGTYTGVTGMYTGVMARYTGVTGTCTMTSRLYDTCIINELELCSSYYTLYDVHCTSYNVRETSKYS